MFSYPPLDVPHSEVTLTHAEPDEVLSELSERDHHRVWLVGGAALAASFRSAGLIAKYVVSVIPTILGDGTRLFDTGGPAEKLTLLVNKQFGSGLLQLRYAKSGEF